MEKLHNTKRCLVEGKIWSRSNDVGMHVVGRKYFSDLCMSTCAIKSCRWEAMAWISGPFERYH